MICRIGCHDDIRAKGSWVRRAKLSLSLLLNVLWFHSVPVVMRQTHRQREHVGCP